MKVHGRKWIAWLLCLCMVLTMLPVAALAAPLEERMERAEEVEDKAPEAPGAAADLAGTITPDGAVTDTWVQIAASKATGSVDPAVENGKIVLSAGSGNGDNLDNDNPAIFVDTDMNKALSALDGSAMKTLSFTLTPSATGEWMGFALMLRYNGETAGNAKAYHIGYPAGETTGWFAQNYGASSVSWPGFTGPDMAANTPVDFEIQWNDEGVSSFKIGGQSVSLPADYNLTTVPALEGDNSEGLKGVAFKVSTKSGSATTLRLSNVHYTGQATINTYDVTGTVQDSESHEALGGVTVTATPGDYTTTTDNSTGGYTLELPNGTYTLTYTKNGYVTQTKTVTVDGANATVALVAMEATDVVQIPTDGVKDTWVQLEASKKTGNEDTAVDPALDEEGRLVMRSTFANVANLDANAPAVFYDTEMNTALAAASGKKFVSFTFTPETYKTNQVPDFVVFGFIVDYNNTVGSGATGYHIGYNGSGWFVQYYGGNKTGGDAYPSFTGPTVTPGVPMDVKIEWTTDTVTLTIDGQEITLPNSGSTCGVPPTNNFAIKAGSYSYSSLELQGNRATKLTLSDIHYSGQETIPARYVKGTVTCGGTAVEGAAVTVAGDLTGTYTQTTDAAGKYSVALPIKDTAYTLSAAKDGYTTAENTVTVTEDAEQSTLTAVDFALTELPTISGVVKDTKGKPVRATVVSSLRPKDAPAVVAKEDGTFTIIGAVDGTHVLTVSAEGYETVTKEVTVAGQSVSGVEIVLPDRQIPSYILKTDDMEVKVAKGFPQAIEYKMLKILGKDGQPATMHGQTAELDTIKINKVDVKPTVTSVVDNEAAPTKVTYTMVIDGTNNNGTGVTATITAEIRVGLDDLNNKASEAAGRTLGFYITGVEYANDSRLAHPIDTIEIANHSLVSVRSTETGAAVTGGKLANDTTQRGDSTYLASENVGKTGIVDFFAAMIYNDTLSASLASNSSYADGGAAADKCYPVRAQFEEKDGGETSSIGLGSTLWYYDHDIKQDEAGGDQKLTDAQLPLEKRIIAPLDMPFAKVVITGDMNGNGAVDWQDGAIAYRDTVMHIPVNGEQVANTANLRISMNFGSMATNAFLIALDNVKRVSAHTDGLGQFVLLKGYAGEGHDSNHPQYDNIGIRMGGAEDMKTLMEEGIKLGAAFGIHTNASEFYAEGIEDENQVRRDSDGSIHYGWNWLDQGISINAVYDYTSGLRKARWDGLYKLIGGIPFTVYVDVWGNYTSGTENDFMTRALSNEILNGHTEWRISHEWASANPYDSTFQHWVTDYTYGDYTQKGKLNSDVIRFLLNQYKDSFPPDFATYGGASNAPLLGGPAMQGFEGWQGDGEYDLSIYNTYNQMVYTKFLQHYPVVEWTNAEAAVAMPYNGGRGERTSTANWIPETQIKLSDGKDEIVVTRGTSGKLVTDFGMDTAEKFLAGETEYRSRVVTLNGKKIVEGAPASAGEDYIFPAGKATLKYLIPWYWEVDGKRVDPEDEKLYHWNAQGGQSTWELPDGWEDLSTVILYQLSDQGRDAGKTVKVIDGCVTLANIEKNTGYVVTKGEGKGAGPVIEYGTGLHLGDPSFNMDTSRADCPWTVEGKGSAIHTTNSQGIGVLKMTGEVLVKQEMSFAAEDFGKSFVSYVAVDNRSNTAEARMTVTDKDGKVVATNYTIKSIAKNYVSSYYLHNGHGMEAGASYFQNMFVYFTPTADKAPYTMTLSRTAGAGNIYFDDLRTVEYGLNTYGTEEDDKGNVEAPVVYDAETGAATELHQNFEDVPQGIWPFVVGPLEGVADNRSHLSELNEPVTQAGWDVKKLDDVIDGNWSVKANGLHGRNSLVYQTIPQNFRFEPGKVYTVSFDYELGSAGSYVAVVGDGAYTNLDSLTVHNLTQTLKTTVPTTPNVTGKSNKADVGHIEFSVLGSESGQTWIGIYSKDNANNQGTSGAAAAFGGYLDFVLDNLNIELAPPEKNELAQLLQKADAMTDSSIYSAKDGSDDAAAWTAMTTAREAGHTVFDNDNATEQQVTDAVDALKTAMDNLVKVEVSISGTVTNANNAPVAGVELTLENASYMPVGLKVTTGEDGTYRFVSKSGVELVPGTYHIKAQCTGYNVSTTDDIEVTKETAEKTQDISLVAEAPGAYVNDFNTGDVSMFTPVLSTEDGVNENVLPLVETIEYNGSGAAKVTFRASGNVGFRHDEQDAQTDNRNVNLVVDKTKKIANGSASFDVTALTTGSRFNVALRVGDEIIYSNDTRDGEPGWAVSRFAIGAEDNLNQWFGQYWNENGTAWSGKSQPTIYVQPGTTRNVRVEMDGTKFTVFIDGINVYEMTMPNSSSSASAEGGIVRPHLATGYVGINMRNNPGSEFIIDNIRIISADVAEGVQNVSGTVKARSDVAISGAAVDLYDGEGNRVAGTTTNAVGAYQISRVEPGDYTMKVSAPFFQGDEKAITVANADLTAQDFTLSPDISSLTNLIAEVEALKEGDYTEESWAELAAALAEAKKIDESSTIAQLNTAYRDLSNAKEALVPKEADPVDFSELRALHKEMSNKPNENYTNDTWAAFQDALEAGRQILLAGSATQEEVDAAKAAIQAAFDALVKATDPDKMNLDALQAAYDKAKTVEKGDADDEAWATFVEAREAALAILSNADGLTQAQVDAATSALTAAQAALTKTPVGPVGPSGPSGPAGPSAGTTTETRPDGTKVTTVTNPDGSKVETVEQPDGTKSEIATDKDGAVAVTVTDAQGNEVAKVELPATLPTVEKRFNDVPETHWADKAIHKMAALEVVNGTGGNNYSPVMSMDRASLATVLFRMSHGKSDVESVFVDVQSGQWYAEAVAWAAKANVVKGISETEFAPKQIITREQLATMLCRYAKLLGLDTAADTAGLNTFPDGAKTSSWALDGMAWCVKAGVIKGTDTGVLNPTANVSRAEVAVMLERFIGLLQK